MSSAVQRGWIVRPELLVTLDLVTVVDDTCVVFVMAAPELSIQVRWGLPWSMLPIVSSYRTGVIIKEGRSIARLELGDNSG